MTKARAEPKTLPVVHVSFHDANAYAYGWASKRSFRPRHNGKWLPHPPTGARSPWGNNPIKWSRPRSARQIDPVMSFPEDVSAYGVFEAMAGNVQECGPKTGTTFEVIFSSSPT